MIVFFLFVVGLAAGSFLNVVIYRTIRGESFVKGRSYCDHCKARVAWYQNIPLVSFLLLSGRCARCKKKISWQYPVVELLTGLLFVWWYAVGRSFFLLVGEPWAVLQPVFWLGVGVGLLLVVVFDLKYEIIPDGLTAAMLLWVGGYRLGLALGGQMEWRDLGQSAWAGLGVMVFFAGLYWLTGRKGFGLGDVKLAPSLGLLLGWPKTVVGVMGAFVMGALLALPLLASGRKRFGQTIPFGPFLVAGVVVALVWGDKLIHWYLGLLGR